MVSILNFLLNIITSLISTNHLYFLCFPFQTFSLKSTLSIPVWQSSLQSRLRILTSRLALGPFSSEYAPPRGNYSENPRLTLLLSAGILLVLGATNFCYPRRARVAQTSDTSWVFRAKWEKKSQDKPGKETGRTWRKPNRAVRYWFNCHTGELFGVRFLLEIIVFSQFLVEMFGDLVALSWFGANTERFSIVFKAEFENFCWKYFWNRIDFQSEF